MHPFTTQMALTQAARRDRQLLYYFNETAPATPIFLVRQKFCALEMR
jgi:hypothetical protein